MYCKNCGKEIGEGMKFCSNCGAAQGPASPTPSPSPSPAPARQPERGTKKKKGGFSKFLISGVAVAAAALFGQWVGSGMGKDMAKSYVSSDASGSKTSVLDDTSNSQTAASSSLSSSSSASEEPNPEYEKIFSDRFIVRAPELWFGDTASFAKVDENGMIENMEYASEDDIITTLVYTLYVDISGASETDKQDLDATMKEYFASVETLDYVTIDSNIGSNYYTISARVERLDEKDVLQSAMENELIEVAADGDWLSMELTRDELLAQGYVER